MANTCIGQVLLEGAWVDTSDQVCGDVCCAPLGLNSRYGNARCSVRVRRPSCFSSVWAKPHERPSGGVAAGGVVIGLWTARKGKLTVPSEQMTSSYDCHPERLDLECPACGSERVLPLAFPRVAEELLVEMPEGALGKRGDSGHRLTAVEVATQEYPSPDQPIGVGP